MAQVSKQMLLSSRRLRRLQERARQALATSRRTASGSSMSARFGSRRLPLRRLIASSSRVACNAGTVADAGIISAAGITAGELVMLAANRAVAASLFVRRIHSLGSCRAAPQFIAGRRSCRSGRRCIAARPVRPSRPAVEVCRALRRGLSAGAVYEIVMAIGHRRDTQRVVVLERSRWPRSPHRRC